MKNIKKSKFNWYDLKQRFSIRKYHFGAASVLLGISCLISMGHTVLASENESTTPETVTISPKNDDDSSLDAHKVKVINHIKNLQLITEERRTHFLNLIEIATTFEEIANIQSSANAENVRASLENNESEETTATLRAMGESDTSKTDNYTFQNATTVFPDLTNIGGNEIDFQVAYYLAGANSGSNWKFRLQLDEEIASKVQSITVKSVDRSTNVTLTRVRNTNIFESNFIRANGGIFGGAELGTQTTTGKLILNEPVRNIINNPNIPDFMAFRTYVFDSKKNAVIKTSATSGVFRVRENQTPTPNSSDSKKVGQLKKIATGAIVRYLPTYGRYGAIVFDQTMLKDGTLSVTLQEALKNTLYNVDIDSALIPYIGDVDLHIAEYKFLGGLDEEVKNQNYRATASFDRNGHASFTIGQNAVSLGNSTNKKMFINVNGAQNPAYVRTILKFKRPISELMMGSKEGYPVFKVPSNSDILPITGYFTTGSRGVLPTTIGNSGLLATEVGLPDKDIYDPETEIINKQFGETTTADELKNAVKRIPNTSRVVVKEGATIPDGNTSGTFVVPVIITYPDRSSEETTVTVVVAERPTIGDIPNKTVMEKQPITPIDVPVTNKPNNGTVEVTGLPSGLTYDSRTGKITGRPTISNWGRNEEERDFPVKVIVKNERGNKVAEKDVVIKVQRDTDSDGQPDVTDTDDDNDGYTDNQEKQAGTDPKNPNSKPTVTFGNLGNKTVMEKRPITPIDVPVENKPNNGTVEVTGLPDGLTYDSTTGKVTGIPTVDNWGNTEEERDFPVKVVVKDESGNPVAEKVVTIKVQRDTDGDGQPDVTDTDDDNDGYTDEQENQTGTNSKDPNSKPKAKSAKKSALPKTGTADHNMGAYGVAALGLAGMLAVGKRKKENEE